MGALVSVNGRITKPEEAVISVYDRGFLFGDAVYEVTRSYGDVFFAVEEHLERMRKSASALGFVIEKSDSEFVDDFYQMKAMSEEENAYIRIQISRGSCAFKQVNLHPNNTGKCNIIYYLHPMEETPSELYEKGIYLTTTKIKRNPKECVDPNIKSGNYLNNIMGILRQDDPDAKDVIFEDMDGKIVEGSTFNIFWVKNEELYTPGNDTSILHGITRSRILKNAEDLRLKINFVAEPVQSIMEADEIFVSSSTKEVMPVGRLNNREWDVQNFTITSDLAEKYKIDRDRYLNWALKNHPLNQ